MALPHGNRSFIQGLGDTRQERKKAKWELGRSRGRWTLFSSQARRRAYSVLRGWTLSSKREKSRGDLEMEINDQSLNPYSRGLVEKEFRDR